MALKTLKYVELDDQKGILYSGGQRSLILPASFINGINKTLNKIIGRAGAHTIIYTIGLDMGKYYTKTLLSILKKEKVVLDKETLFKEACNAISMTAGWGIIKFEKFDLYKNNILIKIKNSPSATAGAENIYSFERGIIAGAYKEIFKKDILFEIYERNKNYIKLNKTNKISKEFLKTEELIMLERKELEKIVAHRTKQLDKKTKQLIKSKNILSKTLKDVQEARDEAKRERSKAMALIINFADGILVFDRKNKLTLINPMAENMLGVKRSDLLHKSFLKLRAFPKIKPISVFFNANVKEVVRQEIKITEEMVIEVTVVDLIKLSINGGFMMILHDVSREKMVDRLKSEFITIAAHQLRTPLSAIKWSVKMLIDGDLGELAPDRKALLMQAYKSNERMIRLVNDLLNVARIEEGRFKYDFIDIQLGDLIEMITRDFAHKIKEKKIKFYYKRPNKRLPKVKIDHQKMRLAIQNLLDNSIKYTSVNGEIKISINKSKSNIKVSIRDTGMGISKNEQSRLFGKFFRSVIAIKKETEGSGLGLFITKNIIEKHGGTIGVKSEGEGKGSEFWFTIPIIKLN